MVESYLVEIRGVRIHQKLYTSMYGGISRTPFALWHDVELWYSVFAVRNICFGQMAGVSIRY